MHVNAKLLTNVISTFMKPLYIHMRHLKEMQQFLRVPKTEPWSQKNKIPRKLCCIINYYILKILNIICSTLLSLYQTFETFTSYYVVSFACFQLLTKQLSFSPYILLIIDYQCHFMYYLLHHNRLTLLHLGKLENLSKRGDLPKIILKLKNLSKMHQ